MKKYFFTYPSSKTGLFDAPLEGLLLPGLWLFKLLIKSSTGDGAGWERRRKGNELLAPLGKGSLEETEAVL